MSFFNRGLATKLLIYFLLIAIVPLSVIGYIAYETGRRSIIEHAKSHLESVAILKEQEIRNLVEHLKHTVLWLVKDRETIYDANSMNTHTVGSLEYKKVHDSLVYEFRRIVDIGHFSAIFILDNESGKVIASSDNFWEGQFKENEPYFIQGKKGIFISDTFFSLTLGKPTMVISSPVEDGRGKLLGVMVFHINLEYMGEIMLERSGLGETGETFIVNSSNLLITNTVFAPDGAFKKWIFGQGAKWALEGKTGVGLFIDYREVPVIGAYRWMKDLELALIAKQDQSEAFTAINKLGVTVLGIGLSVVLVVILLSLFFSRTITRPIHQLTKGAEVVGTGNLDYKVGTLAEDEIGRLSRAFDRMTENLKETTVTRDELAREVTERKRAEDKLKEYSVRLEEMVEERTRELKNAHDDLLLAERLATLGQFSGSISHELRNPLGVIDSSIYFLKMKLKNSDGKVHEHLDRIKSSVDNSIDIIQSILDLTRMKKPKLEKIDLIPFTSRVIEAFKVPSTVKTIREFPDREVLVDADLDQLEMAFNNIIKNAVEAMDRKGNLTVFIVANIDGFVEISFKDTGPGITPENIKKIFQPLFSTKVKGIGFGLSISRMIVERHGGMIKAGSKSGEGTIIAIKLPICGGKTV